MNTTILSKIALFSALLGGQGCGHAEPKQPGDAFEVGFSVATDDGEPLRDAKVSAESRALGATDAAGALRVTLEGSDGKTLPVVVSCPDGFVSPERLPALRLTRTRPVGAAASEPIPYRATCTRKARDVVVVVHSEKTAGVPINIDGKASGATDVDGNAHILLHLDREVRSLTVGLDTSARRELRPQNPNRTFELAGRDSVLVLEQSFATVAPRIAPQRAAAPPIRHIPYRID